MNNNTLKYFPLVLFFWTILQSCSTGNTNDQSFNQENTETKVEEEKEELTDENLKGVLQREIESLNIPFIDTLDQKVQFTDEIDDSEFRKLSLRPLVFAARTHVIQQAEARTDTVNKKLASFLRLKTGERQKKEYPAVRNRYGKIMAATMWEHDVIIKVWGNDNSFITMTNSTFAKNATIKDVYLSVKDALIMFRFKKVIFRAYKGGEETIIDLETPIDTELVLANEIQVK